MENLRFKFIANNFVCYFVFCFIFCAFVCTKSNAQLQTWNLIDNSPQNDLDTTFEKTNFALTISGSDFISRAPIYDFDSTDPVHDKKLVFFQPALGLDMNYRFGEIIDQRFWLGMGVETLFSFPQVSSKICATFGYKKNVAFTIFYDAMILKTNHGSDAISFSKNYESSYLPGCRIEFDFLRIYASVLYEKSSKIEFLNTRLTYDFIPNVLSAGIEGKTIYGSGPIVIWTFGKNPKQISVSWLEPKNHEKDYYEITNGLYVKAIFLVR